MIYFLIINYYSTSFIIKLISSIQSNNNVPHTVVVVNNSPDDNCINLPKIETVFILESGTNIGFGCACNLGLDWIYSRDPQSIVWLINPDAYLIENSLKEVIAFFKAHSELSIVGTIIYTPTGQVWFGGGRFKIQTGAILALDILTNSDREFVPCDWVSGCSMLLNLNKFRNCPQFDPAYFLYYEDFDFCKRYTAQGHTIGITKQLAVVHQPSSITNRNMFLKLRHSTYSYLLTLEKYANKPILTLRLTRLVLHALILILVKPKAASGKLYGVLLYFKRFFAILIH